MEEEKKEIEVEFYTEDETLWKGQIETLKNAISASEEKIKVCEAYLAISIMKLEEAKTAKYDIRVEAQSS